MIYTICRSIVLFFLKIRFKIKVEGLEHIPDGKCVIAINHQSGFDPPLVGAYTPRKMHFMAKEELFKNKLGAYMMDQFGAFPVKRGTADLKSLKTSLKVLEEEKLFGIFIEGTRSKTEEMGEVKKGVGFIVAKSKAPVIPTYVYGTRGRWFQKAGIVFGQPIVFNDVKDYEFIATHVASEIKKIKKEKEVPK